MAVVIPRSLLLTITPSKAQVRRLSARVNNLLLNWIKEIIIIIYYNIFIYKIFIPNTVFSCKNSSIYLFNFQTRLRACRPHIPFSLSYSSYSQVILRFFRISFVNFFDSFSNFWHWEKNAFPKTPFGCYLLFSTCHSLIASNYQNQLLRHFSHFFSLS